MRGNFHHRYGTFPDELRDLTPFIFEFNQYFFGPIRYGYLEVVVEQRTFCTFYDLRASFLAITRYTEQYTSAVFCKPLALLKVPTSMLGLAPTSSSSDASSSNRSVSPTK